MFSIDYTISLGNLIEICGLIGAGLTMFFTMRSDINVLRISFRGLEEKQQLLHSSFERLSAILTQVAVQDTRITMIERSIDELRHGQGYIKAKE